MKTVRFFTVTKDHIKLLKHMWVGWQDCESGAPEIDPKRPYGNSDVLNDIHRILTGERIGCVGSKRDELTRDEDEKYLQIHKDMETVLQILLSNLSIKPCMYEAEEYGNIW